jgi:hypothetical protein
VQPWVKSVLLVIVAMALVGVVGIMATPLAKPAPEQPTRPTTIADMILEATGAQVGEMATATIGPANRDAAPGYFEARVLEAAESKPEWAIANWGAANDRIGPERFNGSGYGTKALSQRWVVFHFSDGSALRVAEIPSVVGSMPNAWRVKSVEVTQP